MRCYNTYILYKYLLKNLISFNFILISNLLIWLIYYFLKKLSDFNNFFKSKIIKEFFLNRILCPEKFEFVLTAIFSLHSFFFFFDSWSVKENNAAMF